MEKVVYILGAGFSAPVGLPVVSNFLQKSKDLYFADSDRYKHFKDVFDTIQSLHVAKSYYETNLFNVDEILSSSSSCDPTLMPMAIVIGSPFPGLKPDATALQWRRLHKLANCIEQTLN